MVLILESNVVVSGHINSCNTYNWTCLYFEVLAEVPTPPVETTRSLYIFDIKSTLVSVDNAVFNLSLSVSVKLALASAAL